MIKDNNFNFFVPLTIEKAKNDKGGTKMKIGGVASTSDVDSDNESLSPDGFDLKPFLTTGFLNWQHATKTSAASIVGEPTKAEIVNNQLVIEGELYEDSPLAKDIYILAQTLAKSKSNRKLGFSIEGQALERGCGPEFLDQNKTIKNPEFTPALWNKIKKARITGCAITPSPKCPNTFLNIIKGEYNPEGKAEYETAIESPSNVTANGGATLIIDITRQDGQRVTVDKDLNITIKKDLSTADNSGGSLKREDLEGSPHQKENKKIYEKNLTNSENSITFKKKLSKSEVYEEIFSKGISNIETSKDIFNLINYIELNFNKMLDNTNTYSKETIEKAFNILGLAKDEIEKGKMDDSSKEDKTNKDDKSKDDDSVEKAKKDKEDKDKDESDKKDKDDKEKTSKKDDKKIEKSELDLQIEKAEADLLALKAQLPVVEIVKAVEDKPLEEVKIPETKVEGTLVKGVDFEALLKSQTDELGSKLTALGEINKAVLIENKALSARLEKLESEPQNGGAKSIITKGFVEKEGEKVQGNGKLKLSISKNKSLILDKLDKASGIDMVKGEIKDTEFAKAMGAFEGSNSISKHIADRMFNELNIELVN